MAERVKNSESQEKRCDSSFVTDLLVQHFSAFLFPSTQIERKGNAEKEKRGYCGVVIQFQQIV